MSNADEFVVLWRLRGHGRDVRCLRQRTRAGLELRVLWGDQQFLTEEFQDENLLVERAEEFRITLEARGWQSTAQAASVAEAFPGDTLIGLPAGTDEESYLAEMGLSPADAGRHPTVLVVDDEPAVRTFLRGYLEQSGYSVCEAGDVDTALGALGQSPVDAVILDVRMPDSRGWGRTGIEVLSFIRLHSAFAALPVMVLAEGPLEPEEHMLVKRYRADVFVKSDGYHSVLHHLDRVTGHRDTSRH